MHIPILGHGADPLVGQNLYMLAASPAVQLVDPDQPAAYAVCHFALLAYMLREIRRGLIGYLSGIRWQNPQCVILFLPTYLSLPINEFIILKLIVNWRKQSKLKCIVPNVSF